MRNVSRKADMGFLGDFSLDNDRLVNTAEAARLTGFTSKTLREWRCKGNGPACIKFGKGPRGRVLYRLSTLTAWVRDNSQSWTPPPRPEHLEARQQ